MDSRKYEWGIVKWFPPHSPDTSTDHPYLAAAKEQNYGRKDYGRGRCDLVKKFAWAILDNNAIQVMASHSPILSVGSGTGYNERLLQDAGADIIATDLEPPTTAHMDIWERNAAEVAKAYPERTLMFCWPCYGGAWATEALKAYRGDTILFVGEGRGGCTGDDEFHEILSEEWEMEKWHEIPQWDGLNDYLSIYRRKTQPT